MDLLTAPLSIEAACLSAWPAIGAVHDRAWLWRFAQGYTKRSNCFQSLDPADDADAERRIGRLAALSTGHGIPPVFRVTPLAGEGTLAALDRLGWTPFEESRVMIRPLDAPPGGDGEVRLFSPTDPRWYRAYATLAAAPGPTIETLKLLLSLIAPEARGFVAYGRDRTPAAAALAVVSGEVAVFLNVVTDRARRRQGFGRAAMTAALGWSREAGARLAAIQVISDNVPAIGLYEGLGFGEHYRYHYRRPA